MIDDHYLEPTFIGSKKNIYKKWRQWRIDWLKKHPNKKLRLIELGNPQLIKQELVGNFSFEEKCFSYNIYRMVVRYEVLKK